MAEYIDREAVLIEAESRIMWGESATAVYELIRDIPAADVAPVRPELRKAVKELHKQYERAIKNPVVRNKLAWALFHTWKQMDEGDDKV